MSTMCEWLSCRDWSDVQLQCGGRAFPAHRAVLASVSAFLRQTLLSCPTEDSPTFIVLPDFDIDAMSSVLYYIYNGEVVIQKQKLERFMEIVKALQIFVDEEYLPSVCKSVDVPLWSTLTDKKSEKDKVFCLGDYIEGRIVNLRKGNFTECGLLKKPCSNSNVRDKKIRCEGWSEDVLGNTELACGDRQRGFLRDLFMETYPRNGNVNGRATGVLAIQSARYQDPASLLLTHANGKHFPVDDAEMQKKFTNTHQWFSTSQQLKPQTLFSNINSNNDSFKLTNYSELAQFKKLNYAFSYFNSKLMKQNSNSNLVDHFSIYQSQMFPNGKLDLCSNQSQRSFNIKPFSSRNLKEISRIDNKEEQSSKTPSNINTTQNTFTKTAVLNEVLDSPWRPRQPTNYRPFRRKIEESSIQPQTYNLKESINDTNNNIQTSQPTEVIENITTSAPSVESLHTIAELAVGNDFKCAVCDQVFTNQEALCFHVRRHSSPTRYSCTECSKSFSQLRNFKYHMSIHRGTREFAATCTVCGKYFNDRGYLSSHMKIHRNRKEYKCSQCPKSFNQRVAYNMHVRIHTGIKPHVCSECGKAFSRKMLLKQHQRTHSGERPYACTHCDKRFADRSNMTLHLRLHTGIKPFSCTLCPKSFTKKHHLKSHLNFHTGAKPYSCPKCKLAFTQSSNMRTHLKKCTAPEQTQNADSPNSN